MLKCGSSIRYHIATILAAHWWEFVARYERWIRPVVFENVRRVLSCRTAALGCHVYQCPQCGHVELKPHSCKSRFCPTCGKHATDVWADQVLSRLLDVPYHHLVLSIPWQLRIVVLVNRQDGLNLLFRAASEAIQQWARDVHGMRMGLVLVAHTFGSDLKWHAHIHVIVTGGGLSMDGTRWIRTDPRFLMHEAGLKKRWKYQVTTRLRAAHREGLWHFPRSARFLNHYGCFSGLLNRLWGRIWYAQTGTMDNGPWTMDLGALIAEVPTLIVECTEAVPNLPPCAHSARSIVHGPLSMVRSAVMVRHAGLFCNRWRERYLAQAREVMGKTAAQTAQSPPLLSWAQSQEQNSGMDPLLCPCCQVPLILVMVAFGPWDEVERWRSISGRLLPVPPALRKPG